MTRLFRSFVRVNVILHSFELVSLGLLQQVISGPSTALLGPRPVFLSSFISGQTFAHRISVSLDRATVVFKSTLDGPVLRLKNQDVLEYLMTLAYHRIDDSRLLLRMVKWTM